MKLLKGIVLSLGDNLLQRTAYSPPWFYFWCWVIILCWALYCAELTSWTSTHFSIAFTLCETRNGIKNDCTSFLKSTHNKLFVWINNP